jgi:hypothetical protein
MTKAKRDLLFRKSRPHIREFQLYDGDKYSKDTGLLWAAHKQKPFKNMPPNVNKEDFIKLLYAVFIVDDYNKSYSSGYGPIAVISGYSDSWRFVPEVEVFSWATPRNILRASVAFFQMMRYSKDIGVCIVFSLKSSRNLLNRCCEYGVLFPCGRIPFGDPTGDQLVYSIKGKKI